MGKIIGIDLGTTNSLMSYWENGACHLIPNALGEVMTPSVVSVDKDGVVYVGKVAKERLITHPECTVSVFKRSMGTERTYNLSGKWFRAEELSAIVLKKLKEDAEKYFGEPINEAIISVPAYFNDIARKATRKAGQLAGLKVERIINEPSAAALACQHMKKLDEARMLVFDFGGGTLDVSLVECMDNIIEIIAVSGNNHLGGSDFDKVIASYFCHENGMIFEALTKNQQQIVLKCAEKAKHDLSYVDECMMYVTLGQNQYELPLSRKKMIQISGDIFKKIAAPIKRVLADGQVSPSQLTQIVMVGGSSKMPIVQQYLKFMVKHVEVVVADPDHMIAMGVGVYTGIKSRNEDIQDMILTDICPFSLGTNTRNENDSKNPYMTILISRNSALPASHKQVFVTSYDNQTTINFGVYQGEDMYVKNNLLLGQCVLHVPPAPRGQEQIEVCFTYDINGLLVVDLEVLSTGEKKQMVFVNGVSKEVDEETKKQMNILAEMKIAPQEEEANKLLISRAEALYAQLTGEPKDILEAYIKQFIELLDKGSLVVIKKAAKGLMNYMDTMEAIYLNKAEIEDNLDEFEEWFNHLDNAEEDEDDWGKLYANTGDKYYTS